MIEKNIFQTWSTRELHPEVQTIIDTFLQMNPEYTHHLYTDQEMDDFVNKTYPGPIADCYNRLQIMVAKADFWRYLVLYKYGGIYLDMDSSIVRPLSGWIREEDEAIITAEGNPDLFVQWALVFKKGHPVLKKTMELIVENIQQNRFPNDIHKMTGPTVFTRAIQEVIGVPHRYINRNTDATFIKNDAKVRVYGIDYSGFFCFNHEKTYLLNENKKHWTVEQKQRSLLL
jgi:mannosyltransferase OCH1-like enzyme